MIMSQEDSPTTSFRAPFSPHRRVDHRHRYRRGQRRAGGQHGAFPAGNFLGQHCPDHFGGVLFRHVDLNSASVRSGFPVDDIGGEFRRGLLQACSDLTLGF
jgi:hypothetical protein